MLVGLGPSLAAKVRDIDGPDIMVVQLKYLGLGLSIAELISPPALPDSCLLHVTLPYHSPQMLEVVTSGPTLLPCPG